MLSNEDTLVTLDKENIYPQRTRVVDLKWAVMSSITLQWLSYIQVVCVHDLSS